MPALCIDILPLVSSYLLSAGGLSATFKANQRELNFSKSRQKVGYETSVAWVPQIVTRICLRQGILLGGGVAFLILLAVINSLNWFTGILTVLTIIALEFFFRR